MDLEDSEKRLHHISLFKVHGCWRPYHCSRRSHLYWFRCEPLLDSRRPSHCIERTCVQAWLNGGRPAKDHHFRG